MQVKKAHTHAHLIMEIRCYAHFLIYQVFECIQAWVEDCQFECILYSIATLYSVLCGNFIISLAFFCLAI